MGRADGGAGRGEAMQKARVAFVGLGMVIAIGAVGAAAFALFPLSRSMALHNPEVAFMQVPVLALSEIAAALVLIACVLLLILLVNVFRAGAFTDSSRKLLGAAGLCFCLIAMPLFALILYTAAHVAGSITNLYAVLGIAAALVAGNACFVFAHLFAQGAALKQDVELTV